MKKYSVFISKDPISKIVFSEFINFADSVGKKVLELNGKKFHSTKTFDQVPGNTNGTCYTINEIGQITSNFECKFSDVIGKFADKVGLFLSKEEYEENEEPVFPIVSTRILHPQDFYGVMGKLNQYTFGKKFKRFEPKEVEPDTLGIFTEAYVRNGKTLLSENGSVEVVFSDVKERLMREWILNQKQVQKQVQKQQQRFTAPLGEAAKILKVVVNE